MDYYLTSKLSGPHRLPVKSWSAHLVLCIHSSRRSAGRINSHLERHCHTNRVSQAEAHHCLKDQLDSNGTRNHQETQHQRRIATDCRPLPTTAPRSSFGSRASLNRRQELSSPYSGSPAMPILCGYRTFYNHTVK